jgi:hypothetical protein
MFGREFVFQIPPYQRPYAWGVEEAGELFDDLASTLVSVPKDKIDQAPPYFLGSIVIIKEEGDPKADVVDGHIQVQGALDTLDKVNEASLSDSQQNLARNAMLLRRRVKSLSMDQRVLLAQYIVLRCFMVVVSTPNFDSAFRIFSVLNDRGLDLSHADVLKADVLGAITQDAERDAYAAKWEEVEENLGRDAFKDLISYVRTVLVRKKLERSVLAEVRESLTPGSRPKWFVDDVIVPYAGALEVIRSASYQSTGDAARINGLFRWLERIDNIDWVPPALVIVSRWQAAPDALERVLAVLERLASVLMVGRFDVNERASRYANILAILEKCAYDTGQACHALEPTDEERRRALEIAEGELYLNAKVRAYVLVRLDGVVSQSPTPHPHENPTVEHVLPQKPRANSQWLTWWPDDEQRAAWTNRLGNLLLLSRRKNSQASNFDFDEKKSRYFTIKGGVSDFPLTTQVLNEKRWTPDVVERRQKDLLTLLVQSWAPRPSDQGQGKE